MSHRYVGEKEPGTDDERARQSVRAIRGKSVFSCLYGLLKSGVHATLAGVLTAFTIPAHPKYDPPRFSNHVKELMARFDTSHRPGKSIMTNDALRAVAQTLENGVHKVETPLLRLEHGMHLPVAFLVIPLFTLINAGIPMDFTGLGDTLTHSVTLGVALGLVLGKFLGIAGTSWLALKLGIGQLPAETRFSQIAGVALPSGIAAGLALSRLSDAKRSVNGQVSPAEL